MPRKRSLIAPVAPAPEENLLRDPVTPLSLDERTALRLALKSPGFQKALRNIRHQKPSPFTAELNTTLGSTIANNRLHEIRGWEMFEVALGKQALDPVIAKPSLKESFIDESKLPPNA